MKLTDLSPKWISLNNWASEHPFYVGLTFRCPHCPAGERGETGYLGVYFTNPVDPANLLAQGISFGKLAEHLWNRTGESFETLTHRKRKLPLTNLAIGDKPVPMACM